MFNINRHDALKVLAGFASTTAGVAPIMAATTEGAPAQTGKPSPPPLDGELRFVEESRAAAADDFGHIVRRAPWGVLLPRSDQDVATTIRWAGKLGRKIAPQGQSHSVYGRAQAHAGIVIDMSRLHTVHAVQNDRVVVDAGAKWSEVLAATLPHGRTPPVLTGYLELSVGGALVVGGVGDTTSRYGVQSDNILELDVVTGEGRKITNRLAVLEQNLRSNGQWFYPHPWLTTFVGDAKIESLVSDELARLTPADLERSAR